MQRVWKTSAHCGGQRLWRDLLRLLRRLPGKRTGTVQRRGRVHRLRRAFPGGDKRSYRADVRRMLPLWGKTEAEFIRDVDAMIQRMEELECHAILRAMFAYEVDHERDRTDGYA